MIPKIIHYCWLSDDPIPSNLISCMNSWKKILFDYEFVLWNFERFPRGKSSWVDQAFDNKKYAFAADYIRLYALYNYGGIYLDTDVEVLKSLNDLLTRDLMLGLDSAGFLEVASFGAEKGNKLIGLFLKEYENKSFKKRDGTFEITPLPKVISTILKKYGFTVREMKDKNDFVTDEDVINALSREYFGAKSYATGQILCTPNTYTIHHFAGSWLDEQSVWVHDKSKKFNKVPYANLIVVFVGFLKYQGPLVAINKLILWFLKLIK